MAAAAASATSRPSNAPQGAWAAVLAPLSINEPQPADVEYLLPENVAAWHVWVDVQTQWRIGMSGATGLDYSGVRAELSERGVEDVDERRHIWRCIKAAEAAVLEVWAERRKQQQPG